jgi:TetR/AcrR family transcriptional regulator, regulator of cefoperazone and chloramphenicol sensitivity
MAESIMAARQGSARVAARVESKPQPPRDRRGADGRSGSRHHRRAQRDRGAETRAQLIEAALDVFGRLGFEGATTREIARAAGANLAAIVYHFGSKEALHLAVAEHVANRIASSVAPALAAAANPAATATPAAARAMFARLIETYVEVMVGSAEAERWARFIVREQMQPSAAFDVIYRIMAGSVDLATRLVATALGRPEDEEIRLRVFAMFGQVLVFRVAQALVLRRMEWTAIGARERAEIKRIVISHIEAILGGETKP